MFTLRIRTITLLVFLAIIAITIATLLGARFAAASSQMAPTSLQPVTVQVFPVSTITKAAFYPEMTKIGNLATFDVHSSSSVVELTYNGRIRADEVADCWYATFELRVDDTASTYGNVRAEVTNTEVLEDLRVIMTGIFNSASGSHTASMWVKCYQGTNTAVGENASVNPDGWDSAVLIVKEYTPLGFVYLPTVQK